MDPELQQEWFALQQQAIALLRSGQTRTKSSDMRLMQLLTIPSLDPPVCLDVYQRWESRSIIYYVLKCRWRSDVDREKFRSPIVRLQHPQILVPTIEKTQWLVDGPIVRAILKRFKAIHVPVCLERCDFGSGSTTYELAFDGAMMFVRYHWWDDVPAEWSALSGTFSRVADILEDFAYV